ncbi:uncharacterized protein AMSG_03579 [Thecamonas trahens ATCC 50062]|uniref:Endonuclease/exonuclease/phosphatase domain-containing protein n=1 Tax=Thecamonas trahens ATCC 50062 TaxID=461836 RepID=A0A0L0D512_THETB|nr:hypothetical protein AMSG_03579 [Thecamonas trahens ATCC 50062]KNC47151.1 hypothetical protein AMSG_03579 [Thecamonas trahens ATCC 50062]|eukprot:XP_013759925.1 hypothetical protein AMSG_03579 [Thecamonas trahens ATCC 50062]
MERVMSVMSYNVLAQVHIGKRYAALGEEVTSWDVRRPKILDEILRLGPDVAACQEMPIPKFQADLASPLAAAGYTAILQNDKNRAETHETANAIIFRSDLFELAYENHRSRTLVVALLPRFGPAAVIPGMDHIAAAQDEAEARVRTAAATKVADAGANAPPPDKRALKKLAKEVKTARNKAARAMRSAMAPHLVWLVCCHLQGHPAEVNTRLSQVRSSLHKGVLAGARTFDAAATLANLRLVYCGDFNDEADSLVYKLMVTGSVDAGEVQTFDGFDDVVVGKAATHDASLVSSYAHCTGTEPTVTFKAPNMRTSTIDFVFAALPHLRPLMVFDRLSTPEAIADVIRTSLPSAEHPSDHLPVCAVIELLARV